MHIRKAVVSDIKVIHKILNHYGDQGLLLPRSLSELYDHSRDFFVLAPDKEDLSGPDKRSDRATPGAEGSTLEKQEIGGVCGLGVCWDDLAEIKSLAVLPDQQGRSYGRKLVEACLNEARILGLKRVFVLTYIPDFFSKFGFRTVEKSVLPHKIWADCLKCPKFPDCDETALVTDL